MSTLRDLHNCKSMPENYSVVKSSLNGWIIAKREGNVLEPIVLEVKGCPFCLHQLVEPMEEKNG